MLPLEVEIPCYWKKVCKNLDLMRRHSIFTDVVLVCKGVKFEAHRNLLSSSCDYFHNMFNSGLKETAATRVDISGVEPNGLKIILNILYSGRMASVSLKNLKAVILTAHKMQLKEIYYFYRNNYLSYLSRNNFSEFWDLGEKLQDETILNAVYIITDQIYTDEKFISIGIEKIGKLLSFLSQRHHASHDLLLKVIEQWTWSQQTDHEEDHIKYFCELFKFINLSNLSKDVISEFILQHPNVRESMLFPGDRFSSFCNAFEFVSVLEAVKQCCPNAFLLGRYASDCGSKLFCLMKTRMDNKPDEVMKIQARDAVLVKCDNIFTLCLTVVDDKSNEAYLVLPNAEDNSSSCSNNKINRINLGPSFSVGPTRMVTATEWGDELACAIYCLGKKNYDFITYTMSKGTVHSKMSVTKNPIVSLQLLSDGKELYKVTQSAKKGTFADRLLSTNSVSLMKFSTVAQKFRLLYPHWITSDNLSTDKWFACLTPTHMIIRFFPGRSAYFDLAKKELEYCYENNNLPGITSIQMVGKTAWALTSKGGIYMQDLISNDEWKPVTESTEFSIKYKQMVLMQKNL